VLIDDIVDSGGTLVNAANALLAEGATEVGAYITHGVLSGGRGRQDHPFESEDAGHQRLDSADRSCEVRAQHPRPVDCPAAGGGDCPHRPRGKRLQPFY
jgi:ribose-phosphate pyrophosphokinase